MITLSLYFIRAVSYQLELIRLLFLNPFSEFQFLIYTNKLEIMSFKELIEAKIILVHFSIIFLLLSLML